MAIVIPFAPRRRAPASQAALPADQLGAILFFTGVRYERPAEPASAKPTRRMARPLSRQKSNALTAKARQPV